MPRRNRVSPSGEIFATPARGTLMGNRGGALHDGQERIVRTHTSKRWISCRLEFKGRRRPLMQPGRYTELFFLDEATALAAGHRPCFECRRTDAVAFARALTGQDRPRAGDLDAALHPCRLPLGAERPTWHAGVGALPDGAMVLLGGEPHLLVGGSARRWSFDGYGPAEPAPAGRVDVLTPRPAVDALTRGYAAALHPSVGS